VPAWSSQPVLIGSWLDLPMLFTFRHDERDLECSLQGIDMISLDEDDACEIST
jgi:hypothetical protein